MLASSVWPKMLQSYVYPVCVGSGRLITALVGHVAGASWCCCGWSSLPLRAAAESSDDGKLLCFVTISTAATEKVHHSASSTR